MSLSVLTPLPGTVVAIEDVPDAVFAQKFVGPGVAVDPIRNGQDVTVLAPVSGKLAKIHPHAFVILTEAGVGVLVHLGLDTVTLQGKKAARSTSVTRSLPGTPPIWRPWGSTRFAQ